VPILRLPDFPVICPRPEARGLAPGSFDTKTQEPTR